MVTVQCCIHVLAFLHLLVSRPSFMGATFEMAEQKFEQRGDLSTGLYFLATLQDILTHILNARALILLPRLEKLQADRQ